MENNNEIGGFTLLELLIVITIIAALTGSAMPYIQDYIEDTRMSKAKSDLDEISRVLIIFESKEKPYSASDLSLLNGRYLIKSPVDPWGSPYQVSTSSALVFSIGPDKLPKSWDDIKANYQPPLALLRVSWIDSNQSGKVDSQNPPDRVQLSFTRKIRNKPASTDFFVVTASGVKSIDTILDIPGLEVSVDSQSVVLSLLNSTDQAFSPGKDFVFASENNNLFDLGDPPVKCLGSQAVLITPR